MLDSRRPAVHAGGHLLLTHGAGSNRDAPLLVALERAFAARGIAVTRYTLPFRQARPGGPPRPSDGEKDRAGLRAALEKLRAEVDGPVWLGGHSYGGRQSSMLASEETVAAALLLLSYPLHAPAKPEQLRTAHFARLATPALFVHGSKDPFGSLAELRAALPLIPARTELLAIENAGHDLGRDKTATAGIIADAFTAFLK